MVEHKTPFTQEAQDTTLVDSQTIEQVTTVVETLHTDLMAKTTNTLNNKMILTETVPETTQVEKVTDVFNFQTTEPLNTNLKQDDSPSSHLVEELNREMEKEIREFYGEPHTDFIEETPVPNDDDEHRPKTLAEELVDSLLTPGISDRVLAVMHASFFGLMVTLTALLILTHSWHVVFLLVVNAALWSSISWFVHEEAKLIQFSNPETTTVALKSDEKEKML
jgi:hypothetical protein